MCSSAGSFITAFLNLVKRNTNLWEAAKEGRVVTSYSLLNRILKEEVSTKSDKRRGNKQQQQQQQK
jgi:hypothetical protein